MSKSLWWIGFVFVILYVLLSPCGVLAIDDFRQAFPIVEPDPGHTKLRLSSEGLEAIRRITNPIAAVAVIGPYRSGKSFTLNQLLSLSCYEGFGVGHMRDTKTKGIWVWGTPVEMDINGVKTSVFYLDTEGFESIGKSNVYDDRIFALATVLSSVLIYNLPETIREADISRLSFAVELAEEFYGRVEGQDVAFEPAKLLWLIQRDFLQGKSVKQMVDEALRHVPNANGDKNIDQVNQIRDSLAIMGDNSTAFSLPQPHLQRTKLCDLKDEELDQSYVRKREQLKEVVKSVIRPKIVQGKSLNGKEFVAFLEKILEALNKGEIPSTGSLVEIFNKKILERCLKIYEDSMTKVTLPISEESLQSIHEASRTESLKSFDEQHFGRHHAKKSVEALDEDIAKMFKNFVMANQYQSSKLCEELYTLCEDKMDQLQVLRLPSMAKFNAGFLQCNQSFEKVCVGPSKTTYEQRMVKMMEKSKSLFIKEYNHRLFNWLVAFSLVMVIVGRFVIKFILLEIGAWILFIFLETYTRMFWSPESLYYNPIWHGIVATWETLVYSPILDLDRWAIQIGFMASILLIYWRCFRRRKHGSHSLLPLYANNSKVRDRSE
ncbi:putative guanylate-binding protein [Helianthus annuus]|nr:putative guanylate-binding protein [Helianthus annuus]